MTASSVHKVNLTGRSLSGILAALFLAVILVFPLFSLPGPSFTSLPPWKVELLAGLYVLIFAVAAIAGRPDSFSIEHLLNGRYLRLMTLSLAAFVAFSALSAAWAGSGLLVSHHTLAWAIYLTIFAIALSRLRTENGLRPVALPAAVTTVVIGAICLSDYLTMVDFVSAEGTLRIRYGKFAELLITIVPLAWGVALYTRRRSATAAAVVVSLIGWLTVMLSLSKGAFLAGLIGSAIFFAGSAFFSTRSFRKPALKLAAAWLAVTIAAQVLIPLVTAVPSTAEYISGSADPTRSSTTMRVLTWDVGSAMAIENWRAGVGADNFGLEFNRARAVHSAAYSSDPKLSAAEDYVVERAHNEYLQVFAELGVIGLSLLLAAAALFLFWAVRVFVRSRCRLSPIFWAAFAGLAAFSVSSAFSSFSFRAMQNGIAFFLVLSVAVNELMKLSGKEPSKVESAYKRFSSPRWAGSLAAAAAVMMILTSGQRLMSTVYAYRAERSPTAAERNVNFENALLYYPENGSAYFAYGLRAAADGDRSTGAYLLRKAIDCGLGTTVTYSLLAMIQEDGGDLRGAEETLAEAVAIYPRSVFARVRYGLALEAIGRSADAVRHLEFASSIDPDGAAGWRTLITEGSTSAERRARGGEPLKRPSMLEPQSAVLHFTDEYRRWSDSRGRLADARADRR